MVTDGDVEEEDPVLRDLQEILKLIRSMIKSTEDVLAK